MTRRSILAACLLGGAMTLAPATALATHWIWPLNGSVINNDDVPVTVWAADRGLYEIPPHSRSDWWSDDVDHVRDGRGQWWKIGPNEVTVTPDGEVIGGVWDFCRVSTYGKDCGQ